MTDHFDVIARWAYMENQIPVNPALTAMANAVRVSEHLPLSLGGTAAAESEPAARGEPAAEREPAA